MKISWKRCGAYGLAAFGLTGALWVTVWALFGMYPFGEKSILVTDMASQYMEFHTAFYDMLQGGRSMLYTWNTGLGMSFFGIWAYYLSSPFTPLLLLFPREALAEGLLTIATLKFACAGASMSVYLSRRFGVSGLKNLLFAAAYGLSGYCVAYCFNLMWLDGVILLPAVILASRRLWTAPRPMKLTALFPLTGTLTVLFIANFYIAYMVGIFSFLVLLTWMAMERPGRIVSLKHLGCFLFSALLAAGISAPVWLPTLFAIGGSYSQVRGLSLTFWMAVDPLRIPGKLAFGGFDGVTHLSSPNLYCGLLTLGPLPVWFLNRDIPRRERGCVGILLLGMAASLISWDLDVAWHAFQPPTWFPARYSFTVIFLLIVCAARTLAHPKGIRLGVLWCSFGAMAGGMVCFGLLSDFAGDWRVSCIGLMAYGLLLGLYCLMKRRSAVRFPACLAIVTAILFCGELSLNGVEMLRGLDREQGFWKRDTYTDYQARGQALTDAWKAAAAGETFARVENSTAWDSNDGLAAGYPAVSHYSSLSNQHTFRLLGSMGMTCYVDNQYLRYFGSTSALDAVLGVKYVWSAAERRPGMADTGVAYGDTRLFRNRYSLPLGYAASREILGFMVEEGGTPFEQQNAFFNHLSGGTGGDCYVPLPVETDPLSVAGTAEGKTWLTPDTPLRFTIQNPKDQHVLLYFDNNLDELSAVYINGRKLNTYRERLVTGVIDLGKQPEGTVEVKVSAMGQGRWISGLCAAGFDEETFSELAHGLGAYPLTELEVRDTRVSGKVTVPEGKILFTTIPWDAGWSAWVDGEQVDPVRAADAFLALELAPGEHMIELRFVPRGLAAGLVVSGGTLAGISLWAILSAWGRRGKQSFVPTGR